MRERTLIYVVLVPILLVNIWCGVRILHLVNQQSTLKEDYAQVNSIRYGLLSVEVWKAHFEHIATDKLSNFKFDVEKEAAVKRAVEKAVDVMIAEMDRMMNQPQKTFRGKVRKLAFNTFVSTKSLEEKSPQYAQAIIDEVKKPENMEKIKNLALSQVEETKDADDTSTLSVLLAKYNVGTTEEFNNQVDASILAFKKETRVYTAIMMASVCLFVLSWWPVRRKHSLHRSLYTLSVVLAFILLVSALALPMIDIDARIKNIDFLLMGEHLQFTNQLLFYRSKSIMQMVKILLVDGQTQTIIVGFLIFLFSIIFPVTKLLSTLVCLYGRESLRRHKLVQFFAYYSGKWSMADVMVVAIFMAYIGFNGVLNGQLKSLNIKTPALGVIATNQTALQPGFTLFLSFVLFGLVLSSILKKILPAASENS